MGWLTKTENAILRGTEFGEKVRSPMWGIAAAVDAGRDERRRNVKQEKRDRKAHDKAVHSAKAKRQAEKQAKAANKVARARSGSIKEKQAKASYNRKAAKKGWW